MRNIYSSTGRLNIELRNGHPCCYGIYLSRGNGCFSSCSGTAYPESSGPLPGVLRKPAFSRTSTRGLSSVIMLDAAPGYLPYSLMPAFRHIRNRNPWIVPLSTNSFPVQFSRASTLSGEQSQMLVASRPAVGVHGVNGSSQVSMTAVASCRFTDPLSLVEL